MSVFPAGIAEISPAVWGILSALAFGIADFLARFTSRKIGHYPAIFVTLAIGVLIFTPLLFIQTELNWNNEGLAYIVAHGVLFAFAMALLYQVLARGPINVVAPIVASHPAFIILIAFAIGSRPSIMQWVLMAAILVCVAVITRVSTATEPLARGEEHHPQFIRKTLWLSLATSVVYALNVVAAQKAVLISGEAMTIALGHLIAFSTLLGSKKVRYQYASIPVNWWLALVVQGVLNAAGVLFLLVGSFGKFPEVTALLSSEFSVVTILLAAIFLRERMSILQTLAVVGVFSATSYLTVL